MLPDNHHKGKVIYKIPVNYILFIIFLYISFIKHETSHNVFQNPQGNLNNVKEENHLSIYVQLHHATDFIQHAKLFQQETQEMSYSLYLRRN